MIITISSSPETGVSVYMFAKHAPKWLEVARLEPGKQQTLAVDTGEPALIVKWREVWGRLSREPNHGREDLKPGVCGAKV